MAGRRVMSERIRNEAVAQYRGGMAVAEIASRLGVSKDRVVFWARQEKVPKRTNHRAADCPACGKEWARALYTCPHCGVTRWEVSPDLRVQTKAQGRAHMRLVAAHKDEYDRYYYEEKKRLYAESNGKSGRSSND